MEAKLGQLGIHKWIGPQPNLLWPRAIATERRSTGQVGHVVMPPFGEPFDVTTVHYMATYAQARSGIALAQSMIGSSVKLLWNGVDYELNYGVRYVIETCSAPVLRRIARAVGVGPHGATYDLAPAIEVRLYMQLRPVKP